MPGAPPPPGVAIHKAAAIAEKKDPDQAVIDARAKVILLVAVPCSNPCIMHQLACACTARCLGARLTSTLPLERQSACGTRDLQSSKIEQGTSRCLVSGTGRDPCTV